ncbi:MAG TPA: hypothetical protein VMU49_03010 [Candidatus Acidoferrales bacterium]|nr:hypothetical protein [Candidatus Acidoferrales bacterium]
MITFRAFLVIQGLVERLPRRAGYALAIVGARFAFLFARRARGRLEENLHIALPQLSGAEVRAIAWRNFRNHSKAYIDLMRLPMARVEDLRPLLRVSGQENLEVARARGCGVLVVSAHMGSWEVAAAIWSATTAPVCLFAEELEPPEMFDWYRSTRQRLGISVLPLNLGGLRQVVKALKNGEIVVTAIDRDLIGTGPVTEFFSHRARIPAGPAELALRNGTPILPVVVYRLPDDTFQAVGYPPIFPQPTADHEGDVLRINRELVAHLETIIRAHPDQWHLPHTIFLSD